MLVNPFAEISYALLCVLGSQRGSKLMLLGSVEFVCLLVFSFNSLFTVMKWFLYWFVTVSLSSGPIIFTHEK